MGWFEVLPHFVLLPNIQGIFSLWIQHHLTPRAEMGQAVPAAGMWITQDM